MDPAIREELLERELELPIGGRDGDTGAAEGLLSAKPTVGWGAEMCTTVTRLRKLLKSSRSSMRRAVSFTTSTFGRSDGYEVYSWI